MLGSPSLSLLMTSFQKSEIMHCYVEVENSEVQFVKTIGKKCILSLLTLQLKKFEAFICTYDIATPCNTMLPCMMLILSAV